MISLASLLGAILGMPEISEAKTPQPTVPVSLILQNRQSKPASPVIRVDTFNQTLLQATLGIARKISVPQERIEALVDLAFAYKKLGKIAQTEALLAEAVTVAKTIPEPALQATKLADIAGSYDAALKRQDLVEDVLAQAVKLVQAIPGSSPEKTEALRQIIFRYSLAQKVEQALQLVELIADPFEREVARSGILRNVIDSEVEDENYDRALKLIQQSKIPSFGTGLSKVPLSQEEQAEAIADAKLEELFSLVIRYEIDQQPERLERVFAQIFQTLESIKTPGMKVGYLLFFADQLHKYGQQTKALELLAQAEKLVRTPTRDRFVNFWKNNQLANIASTYAKVGQTEQALRIARSLEESPEGLAAKVSALIDIATALAETGQIEPANAFVEEVQPMIQRLPKALDQADAWLKIAGIYTFSGQKAKAIAILMQILQPPRLIDKDEQERLENAVYLLQELGEYDQAVALAKEIGDFQSLEHLVDSYVEANQYEKALQLAASFETPDLQAEALTRIAIGYAKTGQQEKGFATMVRALQAAQTAKAEDPKETDADAQRSNITNLMKWYKTEIGQEQALKLVEYIRDPATRAEVLFDLSAEPLQFTSDDTAGETLPSPELLARRLATAYAIQNQAKRDLNLMGIAIAYAKLGNYAQTLQIVRRIETPMEKVRALSEVAVVYAKTQHLADNAAQQELQNILRELSVVP